MGKTKFVGHATLLDRRESAIGWTRRTRRARGSLDPTDRREVTRFTLLFGTPVTAADASLVASARRVVAALKHEEARIGYVTHEISLMLKVRDAWLSQLAAGTLPTTVNPVLYLYRQLADQSRLALELSSMFKQLKLAQVASLRINNWCSVSLNLVVEQDLDLETALPLRPYHSLLVLDPSLGPRHALPPPVDASPIVTTFLAAMRPTKSFEDVALELNLPLSTIFRIAAHLVKWQKSRIIDVVARNAVYMVKSPSTPATDTVEGTLSPMAVLERKFDRWFPSFRLATMLERFSTPRSVAAHLADLPAALERDFVAVVIWLLRHDLVLQLHEYLYLVVPSSDVSDKSSVLGEAEAALVSGRGVQHTLIVSESASVPARLSLVDDMIRRRSSAQPSDASGGSGARAAAPGVFPSAPIPLVPYERRFLEYLADTSGEYATLKKVAPFCRGAHSIEEIMWRTAVTRAEIDAMVSRYSNILVKAQHESPHVWFTAG